MSKYSKAYFNPYSDSFSCRVAIVSPEVLQEAEQRLAELSLIHISEPTRP